MTNIDLINNLEVGEPFPDHNSITFTVNTCPYQQQISKNENYAFRVRKYAKFGVFYAKIVKMTPQRLRRESLRLQKFSVTNKEHFDSTNFR